MSQIPSSAVRPDPFTSLCATCRHSQIESTTIKVNQIGMNPEKYLPVTLVHCLRISNLIFWTPENLFGDQGQTLSRLPTTCTGHRSLTENEDSITDPDLAASDAIRRLAEAFGR